MLTLYNPDGLRLEPVAGPARENRKPWTGGPVLAEHAIRGLYGVTLTEAVTEPTAGLLTQVMGFRLEAAGAGRYRYATGPGGPGAAVDIEVRRDLAPGRVAVGTVHHVAWRNRLLAAGCQVTPVRDRLYFHSFYFFEPGGVLFEVATDPPGFTVAETANSLGSGLRLPPWLEAVPAPPSRSVKPTRRP